MSQVVVARWKEKNGPTQLYGMCMYNCHSILLGHFLIVFCAFLAYCTVFAKYLPQSVEILLFTNERMGFYIPESLSYYS